MSWNTLRQWVDRLLGRHFLVLVKGTTAAQLLGLAIYPILTRLYTPADFGEKAIFVAVFNALLVLGSLSYEVAVPVPEKKEEAMALTIGGMALAVSISLMLTIILFIGHLTRMETPLGWYVWLIPPGLILGAAYKIGLHFGVREAWFKQITRSRISRSLARSATELSGGFLQMGSFSLILGYLLGVFAGGYAIWKKLWKDLKEWRQENPLSDQIRRIRKVLWDYRRFPVDVSLANVFHLLTLQLPVYFLARYSTDLVGQFNLAMLGVNAVAVVLLDAFSQLYLSGLRRQLQEPEPGLRFFKRHVLRLILLSMLPAVLLFALGPPLFPILLGADWELAGRLCTLTAWLIPAMFLHILGFHTFNQLKRPVFILLIDGITLLITGLSFWWARQEDLALFDLLLKFVVALLVLYGLLALGGIWKVLKQE